MSAVFILQPKVNKVFVGKDTEFLKSMLGIERRNMEKVAAPHRASRRPTASLKGLDRNGTKSNESIENSGELGEKRDEHGLGAARPPHRRLKRDAVGDLPKHFDWRHNSRCKSFRNVRRQKCGDCWVRF